MAFSLPITVRFQHCDPAGIVFYPRYFEMFNLVIEEWFEQIIGVGFNQLHFVEYLGVPMARIDTEFRAMSRLEDIVIFALSVNSLGNRSINCTILATCDGETRCKADFTLVCVDLKSSKAKQWPAAIRAKLKTCYEEDQ